MKAAVDKAYARDAREKDNIIESRDMDEIRTGDPSTPESEVSKKIDTGESNDYKGEKTASPRKLHWCELSESSSNRDSENAESYNKKFKGRGRT